MKELLSSKDVQELTSLSRSTLWRLENASAFPRAIRISPGRKAYRRSEIEAWIADQYVPSYGEGDRA